MSTHGRSSSHGSGGWFSGTMEVISGMAPRPSTPLQGRSGAPHARSLSAPNSPARPGMMGNNPVPPPIHRLPSQDSLDRSIHNESGHGKSTAQIVRDLKHANASLSAKQASQEAHFMNQMSNLTKSFETQRVQLDTDLKQVKKQLSQLTSRKATADSKLQEKVLAFEKVKEESAFQRHSISDLKNQLYQLQTELDDVANDGGGGNGISMESRQEMEQLLVDNQEMARELARLTAELRKSERVRHEQQDSLNSSTRSMGRPPVPGGDSANSGYYQKYHETNSELEQQRKRLTVTENTLKGLESDKESLQQAHAQTVEELQEELNKQAQEFTEREQVLQSQLESMEFTDSQLTQELKSELQERDEAMSNLQQELQEYADKVADLANQLAQAQQSASSQENYRRDEAEDLRILHDAQETEITNLRKQLEDTQKELELRDEELEDSQSRLEKVPKEAPSKEDPESSNDLTSQHKEEVERMQEEVSRTKTQLTKVEAELETLRSSDEGIKSASGAEDAGPSQELQRDLDAAKQTAAKLQEELTASQKEHKVRLKDLEGSVENLGREKNEVTVKLAALEQEKDDAVSKFEETSDEFSKLRSHWEGKAGVAQVAETLKNEIEIHKQRVQDSTDGEKAANDKIEELVVKVQSLEKDLEAQNKATSEAIRSLDELANSPPKADEKSTKALQEAEKEISKLHTALDEHQSGASKIKKQLREAQMALVALDDEKKEMALEHRELLSAVEKKKEEIQRTSQEQLVGKNEELQKLQKQLSRAKDADTAKEDKGNQVQSLEFTSRAAPVTPGVSPPASPDGAILAKLEFTVRTLNKDKDVLKIKLKDRDTAIAALVRSSMSLENKISTMESDLIEVRSVQPEEKKTAEGELHELRRTMSAMKDKEPKSSEEVRALRRDLKLAKQDAKRWKKSLQQDDTTGSEYRFQISLLQKELDDNVERLKERDQAIENLVNQSMSQEAHVRDLKVRISSLMKEVETVRSQRSKYEDGLLKAEIRRLQQETEMFAGQIIEQDEELQNLKRKLTERDELMVAIKAELSDIKANEVPSDVGAKQAEELAELKGELGHLSFDLKARDTQLAQMQEQLEASKNKASSGADQQKVFDLQAELDEVKDANADNRAELRDLRNQLWDAKEAAGEAKDIKLELAQAKYALDEYKRTQGKKSNQDDSKETVKKLEADLKALEVDLNTRNAKIAELEKNSTLLNEQQVAAFQTELEMLRNELRKKTEALDTIQKEISEKHAALEKSESLKLKLVGELASTKNTLSRAKQEATDTMRSVSHDDGVKNQLAKERDELAKEKESLSSQIMQLRKKTEVLEELQQNEKALQTELDDSKQAREASEKSIVGAYEKQLIVVTTDKDVTIDQLRKNLAESRGKVADDADQMTQQLQSLHDENSGLREQFEVELQSKNQQNYALEHTLHAQEQIVESMRAEMDQLQSGMEHATEKRRGEVDDLQQELMQLEGRSLKQDREIMAMKMQLEESKLEHKAEVVRLKDALATMEQESPLARTVADLHKDDRMLEVRERLETLKTRNTTLQEENIKLVGRLERKVIEIKSLEFEKERAEDMDIENTSLRRQVKELESIFESARPKSSRKKSSTSRATASSQGPPEVTTNATTAETENNSKPKDKSKKKGLKGLFKRRGFSPADDTIQEED